jgi:HEPN domain-containing protein/predicted nucleotidyltransferase
LSFDEAMTMATLTRDELLTRLKNILAPLIKALRPEFVLLFGSYAYGEPHPHSDLDLLVVLPDAPSPDGFSARLDLVQKHLVPQRDLPTLEWHIVTVAELREELRKGNVFLAEVMERGLPLHSERDWSQVLREVRALMEQGESLYPLDWLEWAEEDEERVRRALMFDDVYDAAYHLQQAIEKGLKAFLLGQGWQLERTHDLPYLLRQALPFHPELAGFEELCQRINAFLWARYPRAVNPPPTAQELSHWLTQAQQLLTLVAEALRRQP